MSALAVFTSNKGGSGRSTTAANVAYRCALEGFAVCCVDLDIRSPTLGAILGLEGLEVGVRPEEPAGGPAVGVLEMLGRRYEPERVGAALHARRDVWAASGRMRPAEAGNLWLLPGSAEPTDLTWGADLAERLGVLLEVLRREHDLTIVDVRAGYDELTERLLESDVAGLDIDAWCVFHRYTPQHLHAAAALAVQLRAGGAGRVLGVRTADDARMQELRTSDDRELAGLSTRLLWDLPLARPTIPFVQSLMRREAIIDGPPNAVAAYRALGLGLVTGA